MGQYKTEAILLVVRDWDDNSRMVTLFSRDFGKISAVAYGARRPRNQMAGTIQPFVQADLSLLPGKTYDSIRQCEIVSSFRDIREDLTKMAYANFLAELVIELWPEREAEPAVFELLLGALTMMKTRNPRITALAGALQLLTLAGFSPSMTECATCGEALILPAAFEVAAGGAVCLHCAQSGANEFSCEAAAFCSRLLGLDWQNPGSFSVTGAVLMQTEKILSEFITYCLDKKLKSLAFIAAIS
ncbi:MAG: repair protein recO [Firmicutes bacterium]|nr:repair protein recO [Bacillota bacterium]